MAIGRDQRLERVPDGERAGVLALVGLIALVPLWYGGATPLAWATAAVVVGLLALWVGGGSRAGAKRPVPVDVGVAGALVAMVVLWALIQAAPIMPRPIQHPVWELAAEANAIPSRWLAPISINPEATLRATLRLATAALVFVVAYRLARVPETASVVVWMVLLSSIGYALYGFSDLVRDTRHVLFTPKDPFAVASYGNYLSATFINRNHYAGYAGLGFAAALALIGARIGARVKEPAPRRPLSVVRTLRTLLRTVPAMVPPAVAATVLLIAVVLSGSRAGLAALGLGAVVAAVVSASRSARPLVTTVILGLHGLGGLVIAALSAGEGFWLRIADLATHLSYRAEVYAVTWTAALSASWTGHGYGTFVDMLPLYRDSTLRSPGFWNAAHNDYLELAATLGLPAALALLVAVAVLAGRCMVGAVVRRRHAAAPMAAGIATVQLALHSVFDFPLQLDGVALPYAALLGAGVAQSMKSSSPAAARRT